MLPGVACFLEVHRPLGGLPPGVADGSDMRRAIIPAPGARPALGADLFISSPDAGNSWPDGQAGRRFGRGHRPAFGWWTRPVAHDSDSPRTGLPAAWPPPSGMIMARDPRSTGSKRSDSMSRESVVDAA
jgi:hypothetical protein